MTNNFNAMPDTPDNRTAAFTLAEDQRSHLDPQSHAATRVAVWVEDGFVFSSGQWSGQAPEGEVTIQLELDRKSLEEFRSADQHTRTNGWPVVNDITGRVGVLHNNNRPPKGGWRWIPGHGPASV